MYQIDGIEHLEEIHQSNHSIVFRGLEVRTGKKVAIKILKEDFPSPHLVARFNGEAELSQRFPIEGVRKVYEMRQVEGHYALLMDYVEGESFHQMLGKGRLNVETFLAIAIRATNVIAEIHRYGIIHKDINPRNLLMDSAGKVYLIDLGIASLAKKEVQTLQAPDKIEGTLAYIAPEQTGRMNHGIDARSDLYSLGITFYEMMTGSLPFEATDALELVHSHIAKIPEMPHQRQPEVPLVLSAMISKMINKDITERYQTATGLLSDLKKCAKILAEQGYLSLKEREFELGEEDHFTVFRIPDKLYGREEERQKLLDAFTGAEQGGMALLLVHGYSGIGKTALVRELYTPVTAKRSYFIASKFEHFQRDIPYSAFIQAVNGLVQQLLGESERRVAHWRREIIDALGNNAGVMTELIPSLELIIGKQPEPMVLPPSESQNRFNQVFQKFFRDLSTSKHPFVVFIDDWQWADLPSLNLLRLLMTDDNHYLLFIAAYRSNEVEATHPFALTIEKIREGETPTAEIQLEPLQKEHIIELLQDTLLSSGQGVKELASLIQEKTQGNPFFVSQFLQSLYDNGHMEYDYASKSWAWNLEQIKALPISDNVLDLMTARIKGLKPATQRLLQLAACIGNHFPVKVLSQLAEKNQVEVRNTLLEAIEQGLLVAYKGSHYAIDSDEDKGVYLRFLHDRVEQAANQMLDRSEYTEMQWKIGQMILRKANPEYIKENLFDIANYLNNGREYAKTPQERRQVASLNRRAGKRAKRTAAYDSAYKFLTIAIEYYGEELWKREYDKAFELHKQAAEAAYLTGKGEEATVRYAELIKRCQTPLQQVEVYCSQLLQVQTESHERAYELQKKALELLGVVLPDEESLIQKLYEEDLEQVEQILATRTTDEILEAPEMDNAEKLWEMNILVLLFPTTLVLGKSRVVAWVGVRMTQISLLYGNCHLSSYGYIGYAQVCCANLSKPRRGYRFGKMAIALADRYPNLAIRAKTYHTFILTVNHWLAHVKEGLYYAEEAIKYGLEGGEFGYAGMAISGGKFLTKLLLSYELKELQKEVFQILPTLKRLNPANVAWMFKPAVIQPILQLLGETNALDTLDNADFSEEKFLATFKNIGSPHGWFYFSKLRNLYILGFYEKCFESLDQLKIVIQIHGSIITTQLSRYYGALIILANWRQLSETEREEYEPLLKEYTEKVRYYAELNPAFYQDKIQLIDAEYSAYVAEEWGALDLYDQAIEAAREGEDLQQEALATERAALFFLHRKKDSIARLYLQRAEYLYKTWGATAKVKQLKEKYDSLLHIRAGAGTAFMTLSKTTTGGQSSYNVSNSFETTARKGSELDLLSLVKASQAISEEIKLELLLKKMIRVLMENAGAERALLIQDRDSELMLAAEASIYSEEIEVMRAMPLDHQTDKEKVALGVIRHTYRTQEAVVVNNIKKDNRFAMDPYIQKAKVKSVLCLPVLHQGKVRVVIYMEHSQIAGAFTQDRLNILNMLSSQVAISIENSVLYDTLEQKVADRTADLEKANFELKDKNNRITDSINYALTMQRAILASKEELADVGTDHFVLYLPKDIVSGDFYWYGKVGEKHILSVVDCTGHGVPGAFMSMIANTLLNEIIKQKEITHTAEILEMLHKGVRESLNQDNTSNTDGMDMIVCGVFKQNEETVVHYTGAKNALYYFKKGHVGKLDADRRSIGGSVANSGKQFTVQELILQKGDSFYMTTDGYTDQAGGDTRQSFSKKRFINLLEAIGHLPMHEQYHVMLKALQEHQGDQAQRDDITVIGIKV